MRKIPFKNYLILLVICFVTIILTLYINSWALTIKQNKLSISPLSGAVYEISINELEEGIKETNQILLYIGRTGDEKNYKFEKSLLNMINKHELNDYIIYIDTKDYETASLIASLKSQLNSHLLNDLQIPTFIYIKNGKVIEVINTDLSIKTLESTIEKYKIGN